MDLLDDSKNIQPKMVFKELCNNSKPHFNPAKNLDGLLLVNHYQGKYSVYCVYLTTKLFYIKLNKLKLELKFRLDLI